MGLHVQTGFTDRFLNGCSRKPQHRVARPVLDSIVELKIESWLVSRLMLRVSLRVRSNVDSVANEPLAKTAAENHV